MRRNLAALWVFAFIGSFAGVLLSQTAPAIANNTYAQKLVDEFTGKYVRLISLGLHAKPPNSADYVIVAHTIVTKAGSKSDDEDLAAMHTGKPHGPNPIGGGIYDVILPLHDASGKTIGAAVMHIKPGPGDGKAETLKLAVEYRDDLAKNLPSAGKLFETTK